ncbi:hypothetical protein [Microcystis aeruginosa]|nr:hypothetical protein [Microcystis aeruginosa]
MESTQTSRKRQLSLTRSGWLAIAFLTKNLISLYYILKCGMWV